MTGANAIARNRADDLVERHADLVKRIASHLMVRLPDSVEIDDLIQAGMIALLESADSYADDRGASFETYAGIRIRGAMLDELRKLDWTPRSVHRNARRIAEVIRRIEHETGSPASSEQIAGALGISLADYSQMVADARCAQLLSLDDSRGDSGDTFDLPDTADGPVEQVTDDGFRAALVAAIDGLPERERLVMSLYYDEELNLKEIGAVLGVSESRVCQLHGQAMTRLRARLGDWL